MGLIDWMRGPAPSVRRATRIASPWSTGDLQRIVWSDIFGSAYVPVTRAEAMTVPAVARGRHLLTSTIAGLPLQTLRGAERVANPAWLYRSNGAVSPWHRMLWTVDDLIFGGYSLWAVERDSSARITDAARVPAELWRFEDDWTVIIADPDGTEHEVTDGSALLFSGPHEGLLTFGADTLRTAKRLEKTAADRAQSPIPAVEIHQTDDAELDDDEIDALTTGYARARQDPGGAVVYTPYNIELKTHGEKSTGAELLIDGRNASAIDVARLLGIPAAMIDASNVNSTLTYETLQGRSLEFVDYSLAPLTGAISARLSQDDVTPRGTRIAFDLSNLTAPTPSPTGAPTED